VTEFSAFKNVSIFKDKLAVSLLTFLRNQINFHPIDRYLGKWLIRKVIRITFAGEWLVIFCI